MNSTRNGLTVDLAADEMVSLLAPAATPGVVAVNMLIPNRNRINETNLQPGVLRVEVFTVLLRLSLEFHHGTASTARHDAMDAEVRGVG